MDFKGNNTKRLNDIKGFCVQVPTPVRTVRSVLLGWRYDMKWELNPEGARELVVYLMEDAKHQASFETGLELWRVPAVEVDPKHGIYAEECVTVQQVEFKVAHLEWALNQALHDTVQPELDKIYRKVDEEHARGDRLQNQVVEQEKVIARMGESLHHQEAYIEAQNKVENAAQAWLTASEKALDFAAAVLAEKPAKKNAKLKKDAAAAIKACQDAKAVVFTASAQAASSTVPRPEREVGLLPDDEEPKFSAYICRIAEPVPEDKVHAVLVSVCDATSLSIGVANRYVRDLAKFVVLEDRWEVFTQAMEGHGVKLIVQSTDRWDFTRVKVTSSLQDRFISAIKVIREFTGLSLQAAKQAVEQGVPFSIAAFQKPDFLSALRLYGVDTMAFTFDE